MNMGCLRKKKDRLKYPCIPSAIQPVPHSADMSIPDPPIKYEIVKDCVEEEEFIIPGVFHDSDFEAEDLNEPHRLNQAELSDLVRDLDLSKQKAELLASRLQQWNLFLSSDKVTEYRSREKNLLHFL
ncbi:uncharacterized protein TNCT_327621 [Trichonephila clavata]|uniref:Uncharacterized protein n=1 Tax=Trichonephila clavata TaxID=2740835 RepID=A0A8X6KJR9_TRICU|nr:uncharacterized protein TNCT_327621 [Trichonephila clavata]